MLTIAQYEGNKVHGCPALIGGHVQFILHKLLQRSYDEHYIELILVIHQLVVVWKNLSNVGEFCYRLIATFFGKMNPWNFRDSSLILR